MVSTNVFVSRDTSIVSNSLKLLKLNLSIQGMGEGGGTKRQGLRQLGVETFIGGEDEEIACSDNVVVLWQRNARG
jgi:hypothetical protein